MRVLQLCHLSASYSACVLQRRSLPPTCRKESEQYITREGYHRTHPCSSADQYRKIAPFSSLLPPLPRSPKTPFLLLRNPTFPGETKRDSIRGRAVDMDVDFRSSRVHSSRRLSAIQALGLHYDNHIVLDDSEGDDDFRAFFPCPFCYMEIDVNILCKHLQNEHCFDLKNAVCPLCAANLGKDATRHFIEHHTSSFKRRKRSNKSGFWTASSASLSRELSSFLGSSAHVKGNVSETTPEPLLTPFLHNFPFLDPDQAQQEEVEDASSTDSPATSDGKSASLDEGEGQDYGTRMQRAAFVQELMASTIF
ncbi:protein DEHYDRATION-INDUCED 19 homolog 6-like isoform X2 [Rhodamnia argentea]|uniref:Protein DEHYDRATION-INDUCED 19 homolog 6-like isoform X2 n=1 Tax=Rhodamnia argentea TaxID=178133 RepID=A0A8B8Q548_9MYRT|nr:protein DEHYDRATION-INDUCED 19 homolog 6-like isoform X2 [Rhodamnia argentea]